MKKGAPFAAIVLLIAIAIFVFIYDRSSQIPNNSELGNINPSLLSTVSSSFQSSNSIQSPLSRNTTLGEGDSDRSAQNAPVLGDLVARLEAKVIAEPSHIGNRILLAQTYSELGRSQDGVQLLRKLQKDKVTNIPRVQLVLASLLAKSSNQTELDEALKLLDEVVRGDATQKGFACLYRGRVYVMQGKKDAAIRLWKDMMKELSPSDPARVQIENELAKET